MSFVGDAFDAITGQDARKAADAQVQSGQQAMQIQREMYDQSRQDLAPFRATGTQALGQLSGLYGIDSNQAQLQQRQDELKQELFDKSINSKVRNVVGLSSPEGEADFANLTDAQIGRFDENSSNILRQLRDVGSQIGSAPGSEAVQQNALQNFRTSPGYQFRMDQGTEAIERSNAASGMLNSGATLQDLEQFGQGIASQEFGNYTNRLASLAGIGQSTSSQQAQNALATGGQLADIQTGIGNARASGYVGQGNAIRSLLGQGAQAAGAAGGFGALFSDRRLKRDISRVGALDSGIPVYHFRYNWSDDWYEGVMADEVEPVIPEAVTAIDGYKAVDYAQVH